jgi:hypothetical protein
MFGLQGTVKKPYTGSGKPCLNVQRQSTGTTSLVKLELVLQIAASLANVYSLNGRPRKYYAMCPLALKKKFANNVSLCIQYSKDFVTYVNFPIL